jgi:multidrug efflux pump subunit AcrA (membrane-fusion protein)
VKTPPARTRVSGGPWDHDLPHTSGRLHGVKMRLRTVLLPLVRLILADSIQLQLAIGSGSSPNRDRQGSRSADASSSALVGAAADPIFGAAPESIPKSIPIPVVAAAVEQRDVPVYLFGIGSVQAFKTVTISSRVDGQQLSLFFEEAQRVRAGDVIAQLDPHPFPAAARQMEGNVRLDEAQLEGPEVELDRLLSLATRDFDRSHNLYYASLVEDAQGL